MTTFLRGLYILKSKISNHNKGEIVMTNFTHNLTLMLVALLMLLSTNTQVSAQQDTSYSTRNLSWVNLGLRGGSFGISGTANFSYGFRNNLISIRYLANTHLDFFLSPSETVWDLGILYGRYSKASHSIVSISGGIAIVSGVRRVKYLGSTGFLSSEYETLEFSTIGIPIECQLSWTPLSSLGIGLCAFGNVNNEQSFAGAILYLQIGELE
jgi:hypothetical protein